MRVLMISTDRNIFDKDSSVSQRMVGYGTQFEEVHLIVFALGDLGLPVLRLSQNVFVYPTNSASKFGYIPDAIRIGKRVAKEIFFGQTVLSTQDPYETGLVGVLLKNKFKFPLQIQIHTDIFSKQFYDGSILNWVRFQISRWTLKKADGIRVVRKKIALDLVENFKIDVKKVSILPVFVDIKKIRDYPITVNLRMKYNRWDNVILVASRLAPEKKVDIAIKAFSSVVKQFPNTGLVIVGQGTEEVKLREKVKKLKLEKNVVFEAWQQDLSSYYKTATAFLSTSIFEGFGMTLVEAAASNCPIITTKTGLAQDLFDDGRSALICPINDSKCIATKLVNLLGNPVLADSLVSEAAKAIEPLNLSKEEYFKVYASTLQSILK